MFSLRLPPPLLEALDRELDLLNKNRLCPLNRSELIREILEGWINDRLDGRFTSAQLRAMASANQADTGAEGTPEPR